MLKKFSSKFFYFRQHGSRKHHECCTKLSLFFFHHNFLLPRSFFIFTFGQVSWNARYNLINRLFQVHLNHLICFIKNYKEALIENKETLVKTIFDTAWSSNDDFNTTSYLATLLLDTLASNNNDGTQVCILRQLLKLNVDLLCKLSCGSHNETVGSVFC